jgi:hypothetical protein
MNHHPHDDDMLSYRVCLLSTLMRVATLHSAQYLDVNLEVDSGDLFCVRYMH